MSSLKQILDKYAYFVSHRPYIVILIVLFVIFVALFFSTKIEYINFDNADMVPDSYEVVKAFNLLEDTFGNPSSILIAIEIDDSFQGDNKVYDLRDYKVIEYIDSLSQYILNNDYILGVSSISTSIRGVNNGYIPKSNLEINKIISENLFFERIISNDYSMTLINISLTDDFVESENSQEVVMDLEKIIASINKPNIGIKTNVAGAVAAGPIVEREIGPDMQRTSGYSIYGIIVLLIFIFVIGEIMSSLKKKQSFKIKMLKVFGSIRFGLVPLSTIIIGVTWTFGFIGLTKMGLSSITSGVISMIMGIGIDFGIQTVMRFKQEIKNKSPEKAMEETIKNVLIPMATTTIAALIGFKAMSMGELTLLKDLGKMMSYGVTACFLAAITFVPAVLVILEKWILSLKIKFKKV